MRLSRQCGERLTRTGPPHKRRSAAESGLKQATHCERGNIEASSSGLGMRFHHPPPAYSNSLRPTPAKDCPKPEHWLELAGVSWS